MSVFTIRNIPWPSYEKTTKAYGFIDGELVSVTVRAMGNRYKCTKSAAGHITKCWDKGLDYSDRISVCYEVDGNSYSINEKVKYITEAIKIGPIPIGQRKVPALGSIRVGREVKVMFNPEDPSEAFVLGNI